MLQELQDLKVQWDELVQLVRKASKDLRGHKVSKEFKEPLDQLVLLAHKVFKEK